jgi:hypothetical protein
MTVTERERLGVGCLLHRRPSANEVTVVLYSAAEWQLVADAGYCTFHQHQDMTTPVDSDDIATEPRNVLLFKEWFVSHGGRSHPGVRYFKSSSGRVACNLPWVDKQEQILTM